MRHTIIAVFLLAALAGTAAAGQFEDAVSAHERGDYATALREFRVLAEQDDASAQHNLGVMYERGYGVPQNYAEAVKWYKKVAEQGQVDAQYNLGVMYALGVGVTTDHVQSHMWFNLAGAQGHTAAAKIRDIVAEDMTPAQVAEARRRAGKWQPRRQSGAAPDK